MSASPVIGSGSNKGAIKMNRFFTTLSQRDYQAIGIDKPSLTVQDCDVLVFSKYLFVLGVTQLLHSCLLLLKQFCSVYLRSLSTDARVKRAFFSQVRDMCCTNHNLRGHAANIYAGAADSPTFNQGDAGTALCCLQGSRHGGTTTADYRNMQFVVIFHSGNSLEL